MGQIVTTRVSSAWRRTSVACLVASIVAAPAVRVRAEGEHEGGDHAGVAPEDAQVAVDLFERSAVAYEAGRLEEAAALLERAYELDPDPTLLYNLARVHEGLGRLEEAAATYREYLRRVPEAPDRGAIVKRVESLDDQIAERRRLLDEQRQQRDRSDRASGRKAQAKAPSQPARVVPWVVAGTGGLVVVSGAVLGLLALDARDRATADPQFLDAQRDEERARDLAFGANVAFAVGGLVAAAGLTWALVTTPTTESASAPLRAVRLGFGPGGVRVAAAF